MIPNIKVVAGKMKTYDVAARSFDIIDAIDEGLVENSSEREATGKREEGRY